VRDLDHFLHPDLHAWVDLPTNLASLPVIRLEHMQSLQAGRVPLEIVNTLMHEMMHHWCFSTPVGEVLALLRYRARHALLGLVEGNELDTLDVVCDLARYEITERALSPVIEGLALFTEHDAVAGGSDTTYCRPLHQLGVFILRELSKDKVFTHLNEVDRWLLSNRTSCEGVKRKADVLAMPLNPDKSIYLLGYLAIKAFIISQNQAFGGSYDKMLGYLRDYFFQDYGLIDTIFGDAPGGDDPVVIMDRIGNYFVRRFQNLYLRDLSSDLLQWDLEEPATVHRSDDIVLGNGVTFRLRAAPIRGISVSEEAEARGYARRKELFQVLNTEGESSLLEAHKLR
jgi:hypothetical protein